MEKYVCIFMISDVHMVILHLTQSVAKNTKIQVYWYIPILRTRLNLTILARHLTTEVHIAINILKETII
jgi:hypothetical protein